jgi:hypothetical protein
VDSRELGKQCDVYRQCTGWLRECLLNGDLA